MSPNTPGVDPSDQADNLDISQHCHHQCPSYASPASVVNGDHSDRTERGAQKLLPVSQEAHTGRYPLGFAGKEWRSQEEEEKESP